ncbi:3-(3-hydroxy-phenyl)propionate transporter MhpT [Pseudomonas helleri]|uniref:3-(3-hydroxy-phenyl)propionate transporter MhpT n=1 Tax=Pseudomonas helleri TaxID=1608996 RepID=A0A7X1W6I6_9PSED|nr:MULTISPECIES: 3-(3-hydroxy-phenyl)propionate transporter MhpT [Pseudomonas]MQT46162.1 3-(3-hydroxy-phenyl)propionate transporter MhpT [Pseudomonas helleri]MQT57298.1 3-(3-hydroxy-phenyl)propionate transporter MhpT [Pseudomonas sp. FSL R10-0399]MQT88246.1 3-(3-hydroxy-phenyl)propionate transporter MhpT [Pseudomonas helleri]
MSAPDIRTTRARLIATIGLCFLVALMEGLDLQAPGIAAQGMMSAFTIDKLHMGWVFSAGVLGMLPGAFIGGRLADRFGRKRVLMASVGLFGLFSLATALAWDYNSLIIARFLTGVGLGASLPNLIALTSEVAGPKIRGTAVSMMYCGVPLGAAGAALVGVNDFGVGWHLVFYIGGVIPLLIVPLLGFYLPESQAFAKAAGGDVKVSELLFKGGSAKPTLLLWISFFFTLMVTYILINWLPSLLIAQGFTKADASWVVLSMQIGAAVGTLFLGALMDRVPAWVMSLVIYIGILSALAGLYFSISVPAMLVAGFIAGIFTTGGQSVLYALAPLYYPAIGRATGVGSAVAIGRIGAMSGPLVVGKMLALGTGTAGIFLACAPGIVVAAAALCYLSAAKKIVKDQPTYGSEIKPAVLNGN